MGCGSLTYKRMHTHTHTPDFVWLFFSSRRVIVVGNGDGLIPGFTPLDLSPVDVVREVVRAACAKIGCRPLTPTHGGRHVVVVIITSTLATTSSDDASRRLKRRGTAGRRLESGIQIPPPLRKEPHQSTQWLILWHHCMQ